MLTLAELLSEQKLFDKALETLREINESSKTLPSQDLLGTEKIRLQIALNLLSLRRFEEALEELTSSLKNLTQAHGENCLESFAFWIHKFSVLHQAGAPHEQQQEVAAILDGLQQKHRLFEAEQVDPELAKNMTLYVEQLMFQTRFAECEPKILAIHRLYERRLGTHH